LFFTIWNPDSKSVREMAIWMPDRPAFGCTVYCTYINRTGEIWIPDKSVIQIPPLYHTVKILRDSRVRKNVLMILRRSKRHTISGFGT
jgi:hypothetical protein